MLFRPEWDEPEEKKHTEATLWGMMGLTVYFAITVLLTAIMGAILG